MRHHRGCVCQQCAGSSTADTMLVGLVMIGGVVLAITTASRLVVLLALVGLAGLIAYKLRRSPPKPSVRKDDMAKRSSIIRPGS